MTSRQQGPMRPELYRFKLGAFEVSNILDGVIMRDGLHPKFGAEQPAETAHALARANRIDPENFEHPFAPTLVDTGRELILFDTGNGNLARDIEAMRGRLPPGNLCALLPRLGYRPEDIDIVVVTHGHPDHIGGLMLDGKPAFPNARYVFGAAEFDFWKRGENVREARKANRALFMKMAAPLADKVDVSQAGRRGGARHPRGRCRRPFARDAGLSRRERRQAAADLGRHHHSLRDGAAAAGLEDRRRRRARPGRGDAQAHPRHGGGRRHLGGRLSTCRSPASAMWRRPPAATAGCRRATSSICEPHVSEARAGAVRIVV